MFRKAVIDIETNGFLEDFIDYTSMPYKLSPDFRLWCIVIRDLETDRVATLCKHECTKEALQDLLANCEELVAHNGIKFDFPALKLLGLLDYRIGYLGQPSTLYGEECKFTDTLLWSKIINPDLYGGHSLAAWGERFGNPKIEFHEFHKFSQEMLEYCVQDTSVNADLYHKIMSANLSRYELPYLTESKIADLTFYQEHFGFKLDVDLAQACVEELDAMLADIEARVKPLLPEKPLPKIEKEFYKCPKKPFKLNGDIAAISVKFAEKVGAELVQEPTGWVLEFDGTIIDAKTREPVPYKTSRVKYPFKGYLRESCESSVADYNVVKRHLMDLGWVPTEWDERDLTRRADKSRKDEQEILETIERYALQCIEGPYGAERCEILGIENVNTNLIQAKLLQKLDGDRPLRVPTSPKLRVGVEKEICPNLEALGDKVSFAKDAIEYYTYSHRKNAISGGLVDDEGNPEKGYLSSVRADGRIATPADTLAANTARYRHRVVVNVPRPSSLYGKKMRRLFGAGDGFWQLGFDFASLEARIQGHYCLPYTDGESLAFTLLQEKPNDIHSVNAKKLGLARDQAKSFSYAALYGASPVKLAKMLGVPLEKAQQLYKDYWDAVPALKELKEEVEAEWEESGRRYITGIDGRRLRTRSKHNLINLLFQSGGAIAVKYSVMRIAQALEEKGLLGNPFTDTIEDAKVYQMIVMHDEVQYAVSPSLMKVCVVESEDEYKETKPDLASGLGHGKKLYYAEPTAPVYCIQEGIKKATKELDINVELGFEWMLGRNWEDCH